MEKTDKTQKYRRDFLQKKSDRRENKKKAKRTATADEVLFIFEKTLENWRTIKIYNTIIQTNPESHVDKKLVEKISTGNCKVYPSEISPEKYQYYVQLRKRVYEYHLAPIDSPPQQDETNENNIHN